MIVEAASAAATRAVGSAVASVLRPGDVVVLTGGLGTGKTVLAQGVGAGLGVTEPVVSPTFAIVREYDGRIPLRHVDVYRLDRLQEAIDLGLEELLDDGVVVIEWGEGVRTLLPEDRLEITIGFPPGPAEDAALEQRRRIELVPCGRVWVTRAGALIAALDRSGLEVTPC